MMECSTNAKALAIATATALMMCHHPQRLYHGDGDADAATALASSLITAVSACAKNSITLCSASSSSSASSFVVSHLAPLLSGAAKHESMTTTLAAASASSTSSLAAHQRSLISFFMSCLQCHVRSHHDDGDDDGASLGSFAATALRSLASDDAHASVSLLEMLWTTLSSILSSSDITMMKTKTTFLRTLLSIVMAVDRQAEALKAVALQQSIAQWIVNTLTDHHRHPHHDDVTALRNVLMDYLESQTHHTQAPGDHHAQHWLPLSRLSTSAAAEVLSSIIQSPLSCAHSAVVQSLHVDMMCVVSALQRATDALLHSSASSSSSSTTTTSDQHQSAVDLLCITAENLLLCTVNSESSSSASASV